MTTSNRHLTAQKLYEALLEQGRQAGAPMTWGDLREFMREIRNPDNTYIKAFFSQTEGLMLSDAIKCWKYKKTITLHPIFEVDDLKVLEND